MQGADTDQILAAHESGPATPDTSGLSETAREIPPTAPPLSLPIPPTAPPTPDLPPCNEPGHFEYGSLASAVAGEHMRYRIYLPPCYAQDGHVYPVLYMFGGNIHDDSIWELLGLGEAADTAFFQGQPPLIIVMPDNGWLANTTTSGPNSYEGFVLSELIPHIEANYCAWPAGEGRAVGGLSRGGYWSLMMAFRHPELFRSVGAHSAALIDSHAGPAEDPVATGGTNNLGDLRILVDIGQRDPYLVQLMPLHDSLNEAGVAHDWQVNEGTHDEAYWRAHLDVYLEWYNAGWQKGRELLPICSIPQQ